MWIFEESWVGRELFGIRDLGFEIRILRNIGNWVIKYAINFLKINIFVCQELQP